MTKTERMEFDDLMRAWRKQDHYASLAAETLLAYKMRSKTEILAHMRALRAMGNI